MIDPEVYNLLSDNLAESQFSGENIVESLNRAVEILENNNVSIPGGVEKQRLLGKLRSTRNSSINNHRTIHRTIQRAACSLQEHVNENYESINDFLDDYNITINEKFVSLCPSETLNINDKHIISEFD